MTAGRKMRVAVSPALATDDLEIGREVMLNESLNIVAVHRFEVAGEVVLVKELLDQDRALVLAHADEERVVRMAKPLIDTAVRVGDALLLEPRTGFVFERIPKSEVADLVLEEVPDISYEDIGGPERSDRDDPRLRRVALPAPGPLRGAPAQAAQGSPSLRPARVWQDDDRQGGRGVVVAQDRREERPPGGQELLPQHQGPRAAQQVCR